jgi:zinc protease
VSLYLRPLAYKAHPYQWSTIGKEISHITGASLSDVKEFFYKHYAPNNAVLVIAGDVETSSMKKLCEKWFGNIPHRNVQKRNIPNEPLQTKKRTLTLERDVPADAIYMAYHMCGRNDNDYFAADLISDLLSNGRSSFFNKNLIKEKKLFPEVEAYIQGSLDPGLFMINGKLFDTTSFETAESEIKNELSKIIAGDFTERDLEKVKNKSLSAQLFSKIGVLNIAMELAYYEWLGDASMINDVEEKILSVNKQDIVRVASEIFRESNLNCIYYKSKKQQNDK